jgi:predicted nucleic acid-binding Zn ribbon protein
VDKVVDTVDNSDPIGDERRRRPSTGSDGAPVVRRADGFIPKLGDEPDARHSAAPPERRQPAESSEEPRGADLAREALRAAREASAARAAERGIRAAGSRRPVSKRRRRWSGPGPDDRDPQLLGRLVSRMSIDRGWSGRLTDATIVGRWPQLVGPEIAEHCTPLSLRDGELVLQAESTAWATQLRTLQRQLLQRLAAAVGNDVVRRIRVVGPTGPSWRHGQRHVRGRGPRDTYG